MSRLTVDALVLNRNLRNVTDKLVEDLLTLNTFANVGVIDSGSQNSEVSKYTLVKSETIDAKNFGLRINRGFNLGINWWLNQKNTSDFLLLLPNDTEISEFNWHDLSNVLPLDLNVGAIVPLSIDSPYQKIVHKSRVGIGWNFNEGPICLNKKFIELMDSCGTQVFDSSNFRGYLSFIELAVKIYGNSFVMLATNLISYQENESHLLKHYDLIKTEKKLLNEELLIKEGSVWLSKKYGFLDSWAFENMARLLFEDYLNTISDYHHLVLR